MRAAERARDVERRLEAAHVGSRPRRAAFGGPYDTTRGRRLRWVLDGLGPAYAFLGRYLSTRLDLLPLPDCLALRAAHDDVPAMPTEALLALVARETRREVPELFGDFAAAPVRSHLLYQAHRATLRDGTRVRVRVLRPDPEEVGDEAARAVCAAALGERNGRTSLDDLLAGFRRAWNDERDLAGAAAALTEYLRDAAPDDTLVTPAVVHGLCTPRLLVLEDEAGETLAALAPAASAAARGRDGRSAAAAADLRRVASGVCHAWLRQALERRHYPLVADANDLAVRGPAAYAFTGIRFGTVADDPRADLREYLESASVQDMERACACLVRLLAADGAAAKEVLPRLRQAVPFRDAAGAGLGEGDALADQVALQVRLARERTKALPAGAADFLGALLAVSAAAHALAPGHDPLREGIQDLRLTYALDQARTLFTPDALRANAERYASVFVGAPRTLDLALASATRAAARPPAPAHPAAGARPARRAPTLALAAALLLAAAGVLPRVPQEAGTWAERHAPAAFLVLVGVSLWTVGRRSGA
jgi:hypothetical protein